MIQKLRFRPNQIKPRGFDKRLKYLRQKLLVWFNKNQRPYPWRKTHDIYKVLIAELMLRRTRSDQVNAVYRKFIKRYPDIGALDKANDREVKNLVYPLGLHWRSSAFKSVAREVREKYDGEVPQKREMLKELPGIGDYVAGAVLSCALNKKEWIVDTNVARVFKRIFGLETIAEARRDKNILKIAKAYAHTRVPKRANLAMLDFAAMVCTALNPKCSTCLLNDECAYYRGKTQ